MKIRDKVTDEVYEAFSLESWNGKIQYCKVGTNGPIRYANQVEILEEDKPKDNFDWQAFRVNAAKDILCAAITGGIVRGADGFVAQKETLVNGAIAVADALIIRLKEDEK